MQCGRRRRKAQYDQTRSGGAPAAAWRTRPQELSRVIDALAAHPIRQPLLQLDRVGVHGMSVGGVTALALAGAQWRVLSQVQHCSAHAGADLGFCLNGLTDPQAQAARTADHERARGLPEPGFDAQARDAAFEAAFEAIARFFTRQLRP